MKVFARRSVASLFIFFAVQASAENKKEDLSYVGLSYSNFEFDNVQGSNRAKSAGATAVLGTYISDYIRTEIRIGGGTEKQEATPGLGVSLDRFYSLYLGTQYPATDVITVYAQYGVSLLDASTGKNDPDDFTDIPDDLLDSKFGVSYILGTEFRLIENLYTGIEYGRLHNDTVTNIRTSHMSVGLKYDF